tara:strand:- start:416 stop:820 length:405 start_codon:yes stop_codon:yes gene_type:complete
MHNNLQTNVQEELMELEVLKKKLSTFRGEGGRVTGVNDDVLLELLSSWEHWTGSSREFYKSIGLSRTGMTNMIRKAKRLKREGYSMPFEEIKVEGLTDTDNPAPLVCDIEVQDKNRVIRFRKVDHLVEYLKKAA